MVEHCWVAPGLLDRIARECLKPLQAELHLAEVGGQHAVALCNLIVPPGLLTVSFTGMSCVVSFSLGSKAHSVTE